MIVRSRLLNRLAVISSIILFPVALGAAAGTDDGRPAMTLRFGGVDYLYRWSLNGQYEFTPRGQNDLAAWHDMVTINVHPDVGNGEQLADLANAVLGNYQGAGSIVRTDSKPRTDEHPAEHLAVAILGGPGALEAVFARFFLIDGIGCVTVYSHRAYGESADRTIGKWLQSNGPKVEKTLMTWDQMPPLTALRSLPPGE